VCVCVCVCDFEGRHCLLVQLVRGRAATSSRNWWTICRPMNTCQRLLTFLHRRVPTKHRFVAHWILTVSLPAGEHSESADHTMHLLVNSRHHACHSALPVLSIGEWCHPVIMQSIHMMEMSYCCNANTYVSFYGPFQVHLGEPVFSQRRDLLEQLLDFYEPDVLPVMTKHYRKPSILVVFCFIV